jgi:cellulose synthase/poly-beta-1,6-N-acetylglucosamine synthase-like glycosyltransferase
MQMSLLIGVVFYLLCLLTCGALFLALYFGTQVLVGTLARSKAPEVILRSAPSFAVLVPAHNEEFNIEQCIKSLLPHLGAMGRIVVIADNCTDATAKTARALGVQVVERFNTDLRGKGFALACGFDALATNPPEVVMVIDADCQLKSGSLLELALEAKHQDRPIQAMYSMNLPQGASGDVANGTRISAFAWMVKNDIRPNGLRAMGLPCQLMGSGMAIPYRLLSQSKLATGDLVEDMALGIDCAGEGKSPAFVNHVVVVSEFPSNEQGLQTQRARWESGHLTTIIRKVPNLLLKGLAKFDKALIAMALDLLIPPLVFFCLLLLLLVVVSLVLFWVRGSVLPLWISTLALCFVVMPTLLCWSVKGTKVLPLVAVATLPKYVFLKIPNYIATFAGRRTAWVRTKRDSEL